jgi:hypothetical protein
MGKRLTEYTSQSELSDTDVFYSVDVSDVSQAESGSTKKTLWSLIKSTLKTYFDSVTTTLTNKTLTTARLNTPKINEDVEITSTSTELNKVDGFTGDKDDLNYAKDLRATGVTDAEFESLDGVTANSSELNITDNGNPTEKVLNVQCKARAYLGSTQNNITDDTSTKVLLSTESYDIGGDFDTANSRFIAPVSGYYLVSGRVGWSSLTADKRASAEIWVNGGLASQSWQCNGAIVITRIDVTDVLYIESGQSVELYAKQITGTNTPDILGESSSTFLSIHLLSI